MSELQTELSLLFASTKYLGIHTYHFKFSVLLVHDEFLLVIFKFISLFVETAFSIPLSRCGRLFRKHYNF